MCCGEGSFQSAFLPSRVSKYHSLHGLTVWHFAYVNEKVMMCNLLEEGEVSLAFHKNVFDLFCVCFVSVGNITDDDWYLCQGG